MYSTILSIAGFDPSGGAGILSDIKTFEANHVYGLGVCSAITFQNDTSFEGVNWISEKDIIRQIEVLQKQYTIDYVKIGIIENMEILEKVIEKVRTKNPTAKIIWDPILKASAGYVFHNNVKQEKLLALCKNIYLITPNKEEIKRLFPELDEEEAGELLSTSCNVLLKSWKQDDTSVTDLLIEGRKETELRGIKTGTEKHGTGCVLSSAILSYLAKEYILEESCREAKKYVERFRSSNATNVGYHSTSEISSFHYITQDVEGSTHADLTERACKAGVRWVQLRVKEKTYQEWKDIALATQKMCKKYNAIFIINDNVQLAKEINADGIHLGKKDLSPTDARKLLGNPFIIGGTANTFEDIQQIAKHVDYIGLGPYRFTSTKKVLSPILGLQGYQDILQQCRKENIDVPIIAIGGILPEDVKPLLNEGVHGVAVSSAITNKDNPNKIIREFLNP